MSIEKIGTGCLDKFISRSQYLEPYLQSNDRTPAWDGNIFVYRNPGKKKKDILGVIPVQIKTHVVEYFSSEDATESFEISDLKNYYNDKGIILFVVETKENEDKMFYKDLMPSDLKSILESLGNENQGTKAIKLHYLPFDSIKKLEEICRNFLLNSKLQISTINYPLKREDAKELFIHFIADRDYVDDYLLQNEVYVYGKQNPFEPERFIEKKRLQTIGVECNDGVFIKSNKYYQNYEHRKSRTSREIILGKEININLDTKKLHYHFLGTLRIKNTISNFILT